MKSKLFEKMGDKKAAGNSVLLNREFEVLDKFQKRVLVFLGVICGITLAITPALTFIPKMQYQVVIAVLYIIIAILELAVLCLLFLSDSIRRRFPVNLLLTMLHSACMTVLTEIGFAGKDWKWVLLVMAIAVVLYITCISIGAMLNSELEVDSLGMLIVFVVSLAAVATATLLVYFVGSYREYTPMVLAGGMTVLLIPLIFSNIFHVYQFALYVGQITLGPRGFREYDPDYCATSIVLHAMLVIFLIILGIGLIKVQAK
uniref:Uncharacterized protein n=1 Tax=Trichobilharzia regenti TaxID=157069 RepID=A0AA85KDR8_TRIRE|nr:unnamed protein product [Trichobilharzia regenti]